MRDYREHRENRDSKERGEYRAHSGNREARGSHNGQGSRNSSPSRGWDSRNEKRTPTTKRLVVSAEEILKDIASDKETTYPVYLAIVDRLGGSSYQLNSREELVSMMRATAVRDTNLVRISSVDGSIYADVAKDGWYTVGLAEFPEYADKQMVMPDDARRLYISAVSR